MKNKTLLLLSISQLVILLFFVAMTFANQLFDLPHYLFGDLPTSIDQRHGEIYLELVIFIIVLALESCLVTHLYKRIRVLEGLLPICANCKRIRHEDDWERVESYITRHSLAKFSHSICPDCARQLYPEFYLNEAGKKED